MSYKVKVHLKNILSQEQKQLEGSSGLPAVSTATQLTKGSTGFARAQPVR